MGLDILLQVDKQLVTDNLSNAEDNFKHHSLSREFCHFMCRKDVVDHEPELNQIGKICKVDISSLYEMENYPDEEGLEFELEYAKDENEKQKILKLSELNRNKIINNIDKVLLTISSLIDGLTGIENLNNSITKTNNDTLNAEYYFSDFNEDKGEGYIKNNFGQDLRNFKRFLKYAKENGATSVWFHYG